MDRPMGPRQPPDRRHAAAYDAIFKRPAATAPPFPQTPPLPGQVPYQQLHDRRTSAASFSSGFSHNGIPPGSYRQSYYPPPPHIAHHLSPPTFDHQLPAPMTVFYEPPDLDPHGLTPAQAYQAQFFADGSPPAPQPDRNRYRSSPASPDRNSLPHPHHHDLPRLGVNIDTDDGRLGIDFTGSSGNSSDDGSSELPWERSMSMSSATASSRTMIDQKRSSRPFPSLEGRNSPGTVAPRQRKTPIVYPAVLSRVADAFRERIPLGDRVKDGLTYKDAFDGREAVDKIAYIIKTTDRNLALLLGRALDAQKFFHDVTYDHRLRDSPNELYQFKTKLGPYVSGEITAATTPSTTTPGADDLQDADDTPLPSGVFTLLTDCYSPTCSRDRLCYSIACPRRLEQQARLNMKPQPGLSKQISKESLLDLPELGTIWAQSVPPEIVKSVSDSEAKRQETINEVIYTERDFVRDMEYLRDTWMQRLQESEVIPPERRSTFIQQVFWNVRDIIAVNTKLRDALTKRQKSYAVVDRIGDIFLDIAPQFAQPFVAYGAHQLYGKYEFEREKDQNPAFAQFVETTERLPESRKLELNAFLTKPTTRLARYPLLLESVLKNTPEDSSDKTMIPKAVVMIRELLNKLNQETGKTENRFNLAQLENQLYFKPGEEVDLKLKEPGREMITKGTLVKRDGEILVHLFDHAILFTKSVKNKQLEHLRVYRRPIPLELLCISFSDDLPNSNGTVRTRRQPGLVRKSSFGREHHRSSGGGGGGGGGGGSSAGGHGPIIVPSEAKGQYWISFHHLGRKAYNLVLWATSVSSQKKWVEGIQKQQGKMRERSCIFECVTLSESFFAGPNKVNCAAPFSQGRKVVYGTDDGVYISDLRESGRDPIKVLSLLEVSQVDVLEDYQLMIVLSERQVITFPLDALDQIDPMAGLKRAKRISSHTSFFKAGFCLGRVLVCIVKSSQLSSTFKALEPIDQNVRGRSKPTFKKLLQGGNDTLKPFREFYIPVESTSIHYLKTKMCVGCSRGFEIVDLETLETQGLLDPEDASLDFVKRRENLRPMALYRIQNEFLLCYDEFAFYVNKSGQRTRTEFMVHWEGQPTGFALHEPYILAFEPNFIEIRHIETGYLAQVIQGSNLRLLFADSPPTSGPKGSLLHSQHSPGMMMSSPHGGFGGYPPPPPPSQGQGYLGQPGGGGFGRQGGGLNEGRDEILVCSDDRVFVLRPAVARPTTGASIPPQLQPQTQPPLSVGQGHQSSMSMPADFSWTSLTR
ncbi:hypothetical protein AGABI2DRAFT_185908 [Agaricus bisporus var. bisporus H97]|uniref:hypothetical protein n=1 Tax=Agaricus bisporus var. bisporus (strain H97 / ATCC MYA-4626 / FGSC 10389) TaxID=936046 RepID=UPI00029F6555|nr:hypothetical protein AGABI2DRAFT_185908 [Agaricus bisporus var. bisporus H97]EKV46483.1 hypothetical protein AGABI2DRAFT_185908 [Agaricus bisporus var. bisporus H97]